jgi:hypothetical protein
MRTSLASTVAALALLCGCGGTVSSPSSSSSSSGGGSGSSSGSNAQSPASSSCVPPGSPGGQPPGSANGDYTIEVTSSTGAGCQDASGGYAFYWSGCDAGEVCPYGLTMDWPPGCDEECSLTMSNGSCQATCFCAYVPADGGTTHSGITYEVTSSGFSGTASTTSDTGSCTYKFTATATQ